VRLIDQPMPPPKLPTANAAASSAAKSPATPACAPGQMFLRLRHAPDYAHVRALQLLADCSAIALMYGVQYHVSIPPASWSWDLFAQTRLPGFVSAAHIQPPVLPGLVGQLLRHGKRNNNRIILRPACRQNPDNVSAIPVDLSVAANIQDIAHLHAVSLGKSGTTTQSVELSLNHFPSTCHQGFVFLDPGFVGGAVRNGNLSVVPSPNELSSCQSLAAAQPLCCSLPLRPPGRPRLARGQ